MKSFFLYRQVETIKTDTQRQDVRKMLYAQHVDSKKIYYAKSFDMNEDWRKIKDNIFQCPGTCGSMLHFHAATQTFLFENTFTSCTCNDRDLRLLTCASVITQHPSLFSILTCHCKSCNSTKYSKFPEYTHFTVDQQDPTVVCFETSKNVVYSQKFCTEEKDLHDHEHAIVINTDKLYETLPSVFAGNFAYIYNFGKIQQICNNCYEMQMKKPTCN